MKFENRIRVYEDAIARFERTRAQMLARRRGAADTVMVQIDESLKLNERTLASLRQILVTAKEELQQQKNSG